MPIVFRGMANVQKWLKWLGISALLLTTACDHKKAADKQAPTATPVASAAEHVAAKSPAANAPAASASSATAKEPDKIAAQHILITYRGAKNAPADVKRTRAQAKKLAEKVLKEARSGADFTALVEKYSEDPGTRDRMGSLGMFGRDVMAKPFSDAAFALKVGQISDVVETKFGFHIIKRNQ